MPQKNPESPIRPELVSALTEILREHGNVVDVWPADEAAAYRDNGGFQAGLEAVMTIRFAKAAASLDVIIRAAEMKAYVDGIADAQAMTGFTDETFRAILDKAGHTRIDLDGRPL
jgi:hypothetical protein